MIDRIRIFLGPARLQALFILFALTGLASLILNTVADSYDWVRQVQTLLVIVFIVGAGIIIGGRLHPSEQGRWSGILLPALGLIVIGGFLLPQFFAPLAGAAAGWVVVSLLLSRRRMPMEYRLAVKHLRQNEYADAVKIMDEVIKSQPDDVNHYRFRAEIFRVWGKLDRARRDYQTMTKLAPDSALAFNGLAEVAMQAGDYRAALEAAQTANKLAPQDWVTFYNLGMIEDRLKQSEAVIEHLTQAQAFKIKDMRHRALIHFYLARAYTRQQNESMARQEIDKLRQNQSGLNEWQTLLNSDQADTLRSVLGDDVKMAQGLVDGSVNPATLAGGKS